MSTVPDRGADLLALYDRALPEVYGYLLARCSSRDLAEELTSETFLAACARVADATFSTAWLIGIARHKLADHWRWKARQERLLEAVAPVEEAGDGWGDEWDVRLDAVRAQQTLAALGPNHRAVLTLRYLDGLSVPETAAVLDRTLHATEALLVRARRAFRASYGEESSHA